MKVLSFNTGYFLGYEGTHLDYLKNPVKSIKGSKNEEENLRKFLEIVNSQNPDLVLVQEVDGGSIRTSTQSQHKYLSRKLSDRYDPSFSIKYRGYLYPKMPILRHMGNSIFHNKGSVINHSLSIGRKNLVQEVRMNDFSVFSLHLSTFSQKIRKKQLKEITKIAEKRDDYVLAGDLNLHKSEKEIKKLEKITGNNVRSPGKTFPAKNPSKKLDLVVNSENLNVKNLKELGNRFSDHRPISFEVTF